LLIDANFTWLQKPGVVLEEGVQEQVSPFSPPPTATTLLRILARAYVIAPVVRNGA
jgi:hypothetical protein